MSELQSVIAIGFVLAGAFFMFVGSIGLLRLPDFFSRTHATGKSDTLGIMLVIFGLAIYEGFNINSLKLMLAVVFVALANPVGTHALVRAAFKQGLKPWFKDVSEKKARKG